jgi:hypothetical protein
MTFELINRIDQRVDELYQIIVGGGGSGAITTRLERLENSLFSGSGTGITITSASIAQTLQSTNYAAGASGWKIWRNGDVEFENGTFRGTINATAGNFTGTVYVGTAPNRVLIDGANKVLKSENFLTTVSGWQILGTGSAEFNDIIARGTLQSDNFVSGVSGWRIQSTGQAEFQDVIVRGELRTSVFTNGEINAVAGSQIITKSAGTLLNDVTTLTSPTTFDVDVKDPPSGHSPLFVVGDILSLVSAGVSNWLTISSVSDQTTFYRYVCTLTNGSPATWTAGMGIVDYGQSGAGGLVLTADAANAPYMRVFTHAGAPWTTITERLRLGNLNGSYGLVSDVYGLGVGNYASGNYLVVEGNTPTFQLKAGGGSLSINTTGLRFDGNNTAFTWYDAFNELFVTNGALVSGGPPYASTYYVRAISKAGAANQANMLYVCTDAASGQEAAIGLAMSPIASGIECTYPTRTGGAFSVTRTGTVVLSLNQSDQLTLKNGTGIDEFSTDGTLGDNSNLAVPTEKAVRTYVAAATPNPNLLINGAFDIWQRGTSFTSATTPANSDATYLMDRFVLLSNGNNIVNVAQQSASPPTGVRYFMRSTVQTINKQFGYLQILEASDSIPLRNKVVTLSVQAKTTAAAINNIRLGILEWGSTADSVTRDVVATWAGAGANPTLAASWTYKNTPANKALTTAWQTFTAEAVTLSSTLNNLGVFIWIDDTNGAANDILDLATIKLEVGSVATAYEPISQSRINAEYLSATRYYFNPQWKETGSQIWSDFSFRVSTNQLDIIYHHPTSMRVAPSVLVTGFNTAALGAASNSLGGYNYVTASNLTSVGTISIGSVYPQIRQSTIRILAGTSISGSAGNICIGWAGPDVIIGLSSEL